MKSLRFVALTCGNQLPCRTRGGCYRSIQRCDGTNDCPDNSDEEGCDAALCGPHREGFLCRNRRCISVSARCDGVQDCGDFSDEETCMKVSVLESRFVLLLKLIFFLKMCHADVCNYCRDSRLVDLWPTTGHSRRLWVTALPLANSPGAALVRHSPSTAHSPVNTLYGENNLKCRISGQFFFAQSRLRRVRTPKTSYG